MDISSLLQGPIGQQIISSAVSKLGAKENQVQSALSTAVPFLLTALNKNAQGNGASGLLSALDKHDGSILDNLGGFLNSADNSDGLGILGHVLGSKQANVENAIGKSSGLSTSQVTGLLAMLAPVVMGYLGKQKAEGGLDTNGITGLIGNMLGGESSSTLGTFQKLLDQNNDGSIMDDVMNLGSKFLGGLFKK